MDLARPLWSPFALPVALFRQKNGLEKSVFFAAEIGHAMGT